MKLFLVIIFFITYNCCVMPSTLRRFFANVVSSFVPNRDKRRLVRVLINSNVCDYLRFIKSDIGMRPRKIKTFVGYQARSLLISINDKYIYKFPLRRDNSDDLAVREERIVATLGKLSPLYVPPVTLLKYRGRIVRKYDFIRGTQFRHLPTDVAYKYMNKIAKQIAECMYKIGCADPKDICDLKPSKNMQPGYKIGWTQGDIYDNFLVDEKTGKVLAMIDWEDAFFGEFAHLFKRRHVSIASEFMDCVAAEYDRLYKKGKK